jgi:hypothetical protein
MPKSRSLISRTTEVARPTSRARGLTAAARRLSGRPDMSKISKSGGRGWQNEAWQFYDTIGEYRYGVDWKASMLSRATLYLAKDDERAVEDDSMAQAYLSAFFGGEQVVGQMLREVGTHLEVAGECYILGVTRDGVERWQVVASTELSARGGSYYTWGKKVESDTEPLILRLWRPHPRRWTEANSPTRAILPVLSEIDQLTKFVFAQIDSRLAGAGLLLLPTEMTLPSGQMTEDDEGDVAVQPAADSAAFIRALTQAMTASLTDREQASSVVPIVATAPGDQIGNAQHLTFWTELQEQAKELRDEAIRRLGLGMDLPAEVVLGTGDTNHWNAWKIDEAAIKVHAEPLLALICESLTTGYLRPLLIDDGMEPIEAERYSIKADTAALRLRPDRSTEALELYDRGAISLEALLREVGFEPNDAPSPEEFAAWLVKKIAQGQTTPELVEAAARVLGANIGAPVTSDVPGTSQDVTVHEARPTPSLQDHPYEGPPRRTTTGPDSTSPVAAASEVIVFRALERAGNRLRARIGKPLASVAACDAYRFVPVRPADCDELLSDAFTNLGRYKICEDVEPQRLEAALDAYCRHLLVTRTDHTTRALELFLKDQLALEVTR